MEDLNTTPTKSINPSSSISKPNPISIIFRKVEESYPLGGDIVCNFTVLACHNLSTSDWVGLYKVGWRSHKDYVYYEWVPYPANYEKGNDVENKIVFPGTKLQIDDSEFYQFCYVASEGVVRGASTPFQFKTLSVDDLIEIEDENGQLLVVKTKQSLLKDQLEKAHGVKALLKQRLQLIESELDLAYLSETDLKKKLFAKQEEIEKINAVLQEKNNELAEQQEDNGNLRLKLSLLIQENGEQFIEHKQQNDHLNDRINSLQDKNDVLNQEKNSMEKRLDDNDTYIASLQEKIKNLVNEKEVLLGKVKCLEEEEERLKSAMADYESIKTRLMNEEITGSKLRRDMEKLEQDSVHQKQQVENQLKLHLVDKEMIDSLTENFQNAEDKLGAAEVCKKMLNEEVLSLKIINEKLTSELQEAGKMLDETRKTENLLLELKSLQLMELNEKDSKIMELEQSSSTLAQQVELLEEQLTADKCSEGSLYALQLAHDTLMDRYSSMAKKYEVMSKKTEEVNAQKKESEEQCKGQEKELREMRQRLIMGMESYRDKYMECQQLQTDLNKYTNKDSQQMSNDHVNEMANKDGGFLPVTFGNLSKELWQAKNRIRDLESQIHEYQAMMKPDVLELTEIKGDEYKQDLLNNEKFVDAPEIPQDDASCPICGRVFDPSMTEQEKTKHVEEDINKDISLQTQSATLSNFPSDNPKIESRDLPPSINQATDAFNQSNDFVVCSGDDYFFDGISSSENRMICPVCLECYKHATQEEFEAHAASHFQEAE